MAVARISAPEPERSARDIVEQVYRPDERYSVLAEECVKAAISVRKFAALPLAVQQAVTEGFDSFVRMHDHGARGSSGDQMAPETHGVSVAVPRSGHKNSSGRFRGLTTGTSVLHEYVRTLDGNVHRIGALDLKITTRLRDEYQQGEDGYARGRKFFEALIADLKKKRKETVDQLGEKRVAALREQTGFRS